MPRSWLPGTPTRTRPRNHFNPPPTSVSPRSADLAGRSVALSADIPFSFDQPLSPHHKLIGKWAASRGRSVQQYTRSAARRHIERVFNAAVLATLEPLTLANLRTVVLNGEHVGQPAIALVCDSIGQLDLGWIESSDAPIPWRAACYAALEETLGTALPIFGYQDLFNEISMYYWEGETEDEGALQCLIDYHGADPDDLDELTLPSTMAAKKPEWMSKANSAPLAKLPSGLRRAMRKLRRTHDALRRVPDDRSAWRFNSDILYEYIPDIEECSSLPPLTLVPVEFFAAEVDDVGRHGMEYGFMDIAGLCPLPDPNFIDDWFASLRVGAEFLLAAQHLIQLEPENL